MSIGMSTKRSDGGSNLAQNPTLDDVIEQELSEVKVSSKEIRKVRQKAKLLNVVQGVLQSTLTGSLEKRIDFVVVFSPKKNEPTKVKEIQEQERIADLRMKFIQTCKSEGFEVGEETVVLPAIGTKSFLKLHCTFGVLCEVAEKLRIEMPLAACDVLEEQYLYEGKQIYYLLSNLFITYVSIIYLNSGFIITPF